MRTTFSGRALAGTDRLRHAIRLLLPWLEQLHVGQSQAGQNSSKASTDSDPVW
jgi:hypothetical protein